MGLNTLSQVLEKRGPEYVESFLSDIVVISEKLDTYRILFENVNGELKFFKKDNSEINLVERTLTDIWETALTEIPIIINNVLLPEGLRFGVAYTPVERPIRIPYTQLPSYVLTDVTKRDGDKVVEVFDHEEVTSWATSLSMAKPPVIYEGLLTKEQKRILVDYDNAKFDNVEGNFVKLLEKWIAAPYSKEDTIEGITIKSGNSVVKVPSYEFKLLDEAYRSSISDKNSRDVYDLVLLSLNKFMDSYNIPILEGETYDQIYIDIISDIYNKYCESNPISESLDASYLTPPSYGHTGKINTKFISNEKTLENIEKGEIYEAMFKVILSSFRKYKKEYGLITEKVAEKFNTFVYMINLHAMPAIENDINENFDFKMGEELKSLNEQKIEEGRSDNIVVKAFDSKKHSDIDNMRVIASIQKTFDPKELEVKKGAEPCVVYVTDMTPFTKEQMENLYAMNRSWKAPVIIASVANVRKIKGEKFVFSDALIRAQLDSISIFNKDIIPNYFLMDGWDLTEVFEYVRPQYEPVALITDKGKKGDFIIQLYFEDEVMGGRIGADAEFNIGEMAASDKLKAYRSIEDNLFYTFRDLTPQPVWSLFDSMVTEYKTWSGQVPSVDPNK